MVVLLLTGLQSSNALFTVSVVILDCSIIKLRSSALSSNMRCLSSNMRSIRSALIFSVTTGLREHLFSWYHRLFLALYDFPHFLQTKDGAAVTSFFSFNFILFWCLRVNKCVDQFDCLEHLKSQCSHLKISAFFSMRFVLKVLYYKNRKNAGKIYVKNNMLTKFLRNYWVSKHHAAKCDFSNF